MLLLFFPNVLQKYLQTSASIFGPGNSRNITVAWLLVVSLEEVLRSMGAFFRKPVLQRNTDSHAKNTLSEAWEMPGLCG